MSKPVFALATVCGLITAILSAVSGFVLRPLGWKSRRSLWPIVGQKWTRMFWGSFHTRTTWICASKTKAFPTFARRWEPRKASVPARAARHVAQVETDLMIAQKFGRRAEWKTERSSALCSDLIRLSRSPSIDFSFCVRGSGCRRHDLRRGDSLHESSHRGLGWSGFRMPAPDRQPAREVLRLDRIARP